MTTGQRMKERRKQLGISAETVALHLGVSPATIYRYENGGIDKVPGDILAPIAEILQTTPAYLMGWDGMLEDEAERQKIIGAAMSLLGYGINTVNNSHDIVFRDEQRSAGFTESERPHLLTLYQLNLQGNEKAMRTLRILGELVAVMSPEDQDRLVSYAEFIEAERQKRFGITVVHPYQQGSVTLPEIIDDTGDMPDAETLALARQILQDKKAPDNAPASSGDSGSKKMA